MTSFLHTISSALHLDTFNAIELLHMCIRALCVYFIGVSLARSNKKIIGIRTPFNFILFIMMGSIFANAIVTGALFLPIIGTVLLLVFVNASMEALAFYFPWVERFVKGSSVELVKDGQIHWNVMKAHFITKRELLNELASQAHNYDIDKVKQAVLASDGTINFVFK